MTRRGFAAIAFLALACGGGETPPIDAGWDPGPPPAPPTLEEVLGTACTADEDCAGGVCLISELSAQPFCTTTCDFINDICHVADVEGPGSYYQGFRCVSMPEGFEGNLSTFCAPECEDVADCVAVDPRFDTCADPEHRGNPPEAYSAGDYRVCSRRPAEPGPPVDPVTCDWAEKITSPGTVVRVCRDYCEYLSTCKERPPDLSEECCGWGCFLASTPMGRVNDSVKNGFACFVNAFRGSEGSEKVCVLPRETCGEPTHPRP